MKKVAMAENKQRIWAILIIILGGLAGAIFIAPFLNLQIPPDSNHTSALHEIAIFFNIKVEILAGLIIGMVFCFLILPLIYRDPDVEEVTKILEVGFWESLAHPTNLPMTIAIIWFVFIVGIVGLLDINIGEFGPDQNWSLVLIIPFELLMGMSGFQMIKRNETLNRFGKIFTGFWAYLNGTILILFGWGGVIYVVLAWFFEW